jgi:hypothetical protein
MIREARKAGRHIVYRPIEKLHNLEALPSSDPGSDGLVCGPAG